MKSKLQPIFINLFPGKLSESVKNIFHSIPNPPVLLRLIPTMDDINFSSQTVFPHEFLSKNEYDQLQKYTLAKRRSEYLTSRICVKISAMEYFQSHGQHPLPMKQVEIMRSEQGRPFLTMHSAPPLPIPEISLSHSKEYGLAVATQYRCGVDIQRQEPTLKRVQERFCTEQEHSILRQTLKNMGELPRLAFIWSGKEAIQKSLSTDIMPFFTEICLKKCKNIDKDNAVLTFFLLSERDQKWPEQMTVVVGNFKNYAIAITTLEAMH